MEILFYFVSVIQSVAISLGVGCSTLAILHFFAAIADGTIDASERRMMGVVYVVLRVAMVLILLTTFILSAITYFETGTIPLTTFAVSLWILISVLYVNAVLMTLHIVPSTIGPAIQASTWYTMGVVTALVPLGLSGYSYVQFILCYIAAFVFAVAVVNGTMAWMKSRRSV